MSQIIDVDPVRRTEEPSFDDNEPPRERRARRVIVDDALEGDLANDARGDGRRWERKSDRRRRGEMVADAPTDEYFSGADATLDDPRAGEAYAMNEPDRLSDLGAPASHDFGAIWRWTLFSSAVWISSVCAFALGTLHIPMNDRTAFFNALGETDHRVYVTVFALALGPLALIWMAALVARQAKALRVETRFLQEASDKLAERIQSSPEMAQARPDIAFTSAQDAEALKREAGETVEALHRLEESFIAAEQRARTARERVQVESVSLAQMFEDRQTNGAAPVDLEKRVGDFAAMVANALAASGVAHMSAHRHADASMSNTPMSSAPMSNSPLSEPPLRSPGSVVRPVSVESTPEIARGFQDAQEEVERASQPMAPPHLDAIDNDLGEIGALRRRLSEASSSTTNDLEEVDPDSFFGPASDRRSIETRGADPRADEFDPGRSEMNDPEPTSSHLSDAMRSPLEAPTGDALHDHERDLHDRDLHDRDLHDRDLHDRDLHERGERDEARAEEDYAGPTLVHDAEPGGLDWTKFVRAANFPDSEEDRETLDALYAVLTDRDAAGLLQAAEDALSGLADIGLFMEDMRPHHAPIDAWRRYIVDSDRRDVMELGGVRDPHAIEDVISALNDKPDFSMTAERFLKRYEEMLARLFNEGRDPEMAVQLADTRSGRAYMLLGRSSGRFG